MIEKKPFINYTLEEEKEAKRIISLRLNDEERLLLNKDKKTLNCDRDGTVIKALIQAGRIVLHDPKTRSFFKILLRIRKKGESLDLQ